MVAKIRQVRWDAKSLGDFLLTFSNHTRHIIQSFPLMHPQDGRHSDGPSHHHPRPPSPTKMSTRPANMTAHGEHQDTRPHNGISIAASIPSSDTARNAASSSSTASMPSNANNERRPRRPAATDVMASSPEHDRLLPMLSEVARYVERRQLGMFHK